MKTYFAGILILLSPLLAIGSTAPKSSSPWNVGSKAQLFIDQLLVREAKAVSFTQHSGKKHPANPLIEPDQPWEPWAVGTSCSVIYDEQEKLFKMWYANHESREPGKEHLYFDAMTICYATSRDGVRWEKPLVGSVKSRNGQPHNAVVYPMHHASVIKDLRDPDPQRRYKMVGFGYQEMKGYQTLVSPDGIKWSRLSKEPIAPESDVISGYYDRALGKFVAFPKIHQEVFGVRRRAFSTMLSDDFVTWTKPVSSFVNDLRDDAGTLAAVERIRPLLDEPDDPTQMRTEFYRVGVYQAESCTVGFARMLMISARGRYGNYQGPLELQLAVSRDLISWERPFRTPVVEFGELHEWDGAHFSNAAEAIRVGDEIWLYYKGGNDVHGHGEAKRTGFVEMPGRGKVPLRSSIGLAMWKLDRFVSVDGPKEGGSLLTVPIVFDGDRLEINAVTRAGGNISVEILDVAGRSLQGGVISKPFSGDALRHTMTFPGEAISSLRGKPVSLRFNLKDAELYSFAFRAGSKTSGVLEVNRRGRSGAE